MKVLLINNLYGRFARGGAERIVATIAEELERVGHTVSIFTVGPLESLASFWPRIDYSEVPSTSLRVYRFFPNNLFSIVTINRRPTWLRFFWHAIDPVNDHPAWALLWVIHKENPDIVWTHNLKGLGGWIPWLLRRTKIPHVHHLHDVQLIEPSGLMFPAAHTLANYSHVLKNMRIEFRRMYTAANRWLMGSPTLVVSPTQWLLDLHLTHGFFKKSKTLVLANPTPSCPVRVPRSSDSLLPEQSRRPSRGEEATLRQAQGINFLFAGQLVEHKGIRFLIDALKAYDFSFSWELHIAGAGALESTLRTELAHDARFIFHGKLSAQPFEQVWSQIDLIIVPSLCLENAPTVILESLARGIPVLASRVGGIPEMVKEGESGWMFEAGNADELLKTLGRSIRDIRDGFRPKHQTPQSPDDYAHQVLATI